MADAVILQDLVDGFLFVVRARHGPARHRGARGLSREGGPHPSARSSTTGRRCCPTPATAGAVPTRRRSTHRSSGRLHSPVSSVRSGWLPPGRDRRDHRRIPRRGGRAPARARDVSRGGVRTSAKAILSAVVLQLCLYYLDLYEDFATPRHLDSILRLAQAFLAGTLILALAYYSEPRPAGQSRHPAHASADRLRGGGSVAAISSSSSGATRRSAREPPHPGNRHVGAAHRPGDRPPQAHGLPGRGLPRRVDPGSRPSAREPVRRRNPRRPPARRRAERVTIILVALDDFRGRLR